SQNFLFSKMKFGLGTIISASKCLLFSAAFSAVSLVLFNLWELNKHKLFKYSKKNKLKRNFAANSHSHRYYGKRFGGYPFGQFNIYCWKKNGFMGNKSLDANMIFKTMQVKHLRSEQMFNLITNKLVMLMKVRPIF